MSTACPACGTDNRDAAMFCRGCLGKLQAFAPTAPSLLQTLPPAPPAERVAARRSGLPIQFLGAGTIASWLGFGVLALVMGLGLLVWYATTVRVPHLRASAGTAPAPAAAVAAVPPAPPREAVEVLAAAHLREPAPEQANGAMPDALQSDDAGASRGVQPAGKGLAARAPADARTAAMTANGAKPRKDRKLVPVVASLSGAPAACDRYNPYGEALCTQGGYPYATWSKSRRFRWR